MGKVPTISINKTDGCHVYLSKDSLSCEIVSAKSSEMNILVPGNDGDFVSILSQGHFLKKKCWRISLVIFYICLIVNKNNCPFEVHQYLKDRLTGCCVGFWSFFVSFVDRNKIKNIPDSSCMSNMNFNWTSLSYSLSQTECPVPEQFKTVWDGKKLVTTATEIAG